MVRTSKSLAAAEIDKALSLLYFLGFYMPVKGTGARHSADLLENPNGELSRWSDHQESGLWRQKAAEISHPPQPGKAALARKEV